MIVEAIDKRTGKTVKIEEAYSGQRLTCPHCGVKRISGRCWSLSRKASIGICAASLCGIARKRKK